MAELLTRKLAIRLDYKEYVSALFRSQPGPIPESKTAAVRLADLEAKIHTLLDPLPYTFELEDSRSRSGTVPIIHFQQSYHGPPPPRTKTLPSLSSHLLACPSTLPCASSQPSHIARGSLLSHPPSNGMLLHTRKLCSLLVWI